MKKRRLSDGIFLLIIFLILAAPFWLFYYVCYAMHVDVVNEITADRIIQVRPRMTLVQLTNILGRPYYIGTTAGGVHVMGCKTPKPLDTIVAANTDIAGFIQAVSRDTVCCCDGYKEDIKSWDHVFYFEYTRQPYFANVMLKAKIDSSLHMLALYAYAHDGIGTQRIYKISTVASEYFCDKKLLKKYFD